MKCFYFLALIIGALTLIEVRCEDQMVIQNADPEDVAEGNSYEQFNFLTEINVDSNNEEDKLNWNTCSNYTAIDLFLKKTGSEDCLGRVINCTVNSVDATTNNSNNHESCRCLCNRLHDSTSNSSIPELLDSICSDEVLADFRNDYVLTGVRLRRLKNTLMLEIQQGKIKEGKILSNTLQWVPSSIKCNKIGKMTASKRTLILDDVILRESAIITGVAFRRYSDIPQDQRSHPESPEVLEKDPFFLTVIGHRLSYDNIFDPDLKTNTWGWNYSLENRINLINDDMDIPFALEYSSHNHILSKPRENYVTFELTKPEQGLRKFVIPFIDTKNVTAPNNPQIVKGIGLYYKGYKGHGGYIAPRMIVPEYSDRKSDTQTSKKVY